MTGSIPTTHAEPKESSGSFRCYRYGGPLRRPFSRAEEYRNGRVQPPGLRAREVVRRIGGTIQCSLALLGCRYPDGLGAVGSDGVVDCLFEEAYL